jgi:hypothetical protein
MNTKRILMGGLLAAIIIAVAETLLWAGVLADVMSATRAQKRLVEASWGNTSYLATTVALGLMLAWLYAAIRPRFGPGPSTALKAGAFLWVATWLIYYLWLAPSGRGLLFLKPSITALALAWELASVLLAALAVGWIYREGPGRSPKLT